MLCALAAKAQTPYRRSLKLMGSGFEITVIANDSMQGNQYINLTKNEIARIEKLISS
jgi:thiamine biosynthesis lipoprotein